MVEGSNPSGPIHDNSRTDIGLTASQRKSAESSDRPENPKSIKNLRGEVDEDLDLLIQRWPSLPLTIKEKILKLTE
ncbi:MAG: hypothetical protein AMJ75_04500 [Phycisphaerae bacterium SM1_79]|nr:MAG: hypothetical protein AMJ75_04500 [Phycisphaerae bacterium SM1_79]